MKLKLKKINEPRFIIENLKECLNELGLTQADLAKKFSLSRAYICDITKGKRYLPEKIKNFLENK